MNNIKTMMSTNFIEYASYVIKERAIPDINDGLKPVQRRILHSLYELDDGKFNKVANVVGHTMRYHPHGDASIFSSLVVLANKELFIDKQGNFGNIYTGDEASASRYIECRLSQLAKEVLFNDDLTEYSSSYDGRNKEPVTLPLRIPGLLLMGAEGIAVGMSTKILPHNFSELLDAQIKILQDKPYAVYPDFQQGGTIDVGEYQKGNGKIKVRAVIEVRDNKTLVIKEIPYGTTTQSVINSIENATKKGKIKIATINDFTAENVEIELKVARGEDANDVLKSLYAYSDCEQSISVNLITIVNNKPKMLNVNQVLEYNTKKLVNDLKKNLEIEKGKLEKKLNDLTLEQIFIENRIYKKIEELKSYEIILSTIKKEMEKFKQMFIRPLTNDDIENLLQIKIKRISRFDIDNHRRDIDDIVRKIKEIEVNLRNLKKYTINFLTKLIEKYREIYKRRTKIEKMESISIKEVSRDDIKIYWDKKTGFFGTEVKGDYYFTGSAFDKFLIIAEDSTYKVVNVSDKVFVDIHLLYINKFDNKNFFSVIYTDLNTKISYAKKFKIDKFITNKVYRLAPSDKAKINYLSTSLNDKVMVYYEKKAKQKIKQEIFDFTKIELKSPGVRGNRVSTKTVASIKKIEKGNKNKNEE